MDKTCKRCGATKPLTEFGMLKDGGHNRYCRPCMVLFSRESAQRHPERVKRNKRREYLRRHFGDDDFQKVLDTDPNWRMPIRGKDGRIVNTPDGRSCNRCKEVKPLTEFYRKPLTERNKGAFFPSCKACHSINGREWRQTNAAKISKEKSAYHRQKKYGLSQPAFEAKLAEQNFRCACCGSPDPKTKLGWAVDHDHKTGVVRDILCRGCNQMVGHCEESVERLTMIMNYILKWKQVSPPEPASSSYYLC